MEIKITRQDNLKLFSEELNEALIDAMGAVGEEISGWINKETPHGATDTLARGTFPEIFIRGKTYEEVITNPVGYAEYIIGDGAGPAVGHGKWWPPIGPLKLWALRILGDEKIAYAIRAKIHKKGLKGKKLFQKAEEKFKDKAIRFIENHIKNVERKISK